MRFVGGSFLASIGHLVLFGPLWGSRFLNGLRPSRKSAVPFATATQPRETEMTKLPGALILAAIALSVHAATSAGGTAMSAAALASAASGTKEVKPKAARKGPCSPYPCGQRAEDVIQPAAIQRRGCSHALRPFSSCGAESWSGCLLFSGAGDGSEVA